EQPGGGSPLQRQMAASTRRRRDDAEQTGGPERADGAMHRKRKQQTFGAPKPPLCKVVQRAEQEESDQYDVEDDVRPHARQSTGPPCGSLALPEALPPARRSWLHGSLTEPRLPPYIRERPTGERHERLRFLFTPRQRRAAIGHRCLARVRAGPRVIQ